MRYSKIIFCSLFLFIFSLKTMAQSYYDLQWKQVETNYKQGLYKSNLPIILQIQDKAMKENNGIQLIKSLKAEFSIVNQTHDDEKNDAASQFFGKLMKMDSQLKGEEKLIYKVLLGEFFTDYFNRYQWKITQKTNINSQDFSQIETWSKLDFKNYLSKHFSDLESEKSALQNIDLKKYQSIFENTEDIAYFPTLFDWNAVKYIDFLKNSTLFTPNERKANQAKISSIYDELISKNSGNSKLYFQHKKVKDECNFNHCKNELQQLENIVNNGVSGDYKVLIIDDIVNHLKSENKFTEALVWTEKAKQLYSKSEFLNNIKNQENEIKNPSVTIHFENITQSNKPIHLVAEHKNADEFSINLYEVKADYQSFLKFVMNEWDGNQFAKLNKNLLKKLNFQLNNPKDFKTYKTSLELENLPSGIYVGEYFVGNSEKQTFWFIASNSRVIFNKKNMNSDNQLRLVDRENGKALSNEKLEFYEFANGETVTKSDGKSDEKGVFNLPKTGLNDYYRQILVRQPKTNDFDLFASNGDYYQPYKNDKVNYQVQIFLDREIYRPGQTVYFKTIITKLDAGATKEKVAENLAQEISLYDANGQKISSQNFKTNDFGSFNGSFVLPSGKLNGNFSLRNVGKEVRGSKNFSVEEYKRPKFEVSFEPIKSEYKYGETIELKGKAMMFSGVLLSNSTVNYEIKKQNIRWRYFWWYPRTSETENSILGEAKTNEKGEFTIKLDLKKDETLEGIQIDNYAVNASVTDINGETQSAETNVKVSSVSHYIKADEVGNVFTDEDVKLNVATKNYNDQDLQKPYHVKLSKLEEPNRIFRENFNQEVQDLPKFSKGEFINKFPHDFFDKNDDIKNWKVEKIIRDIVIPNDAKQSEESVSQKDSSLSSFVQNDKNLDLGKLEAGTYMLELYNIEGKDTIKAEQYIKVWDKKRLEKSQKPFLEVVEPKGETKRGEKAKIYVYSAVGNSLSFGEGRGEALVNVFVQNGKGETTTETLKMNNGVLVYEVPMSLDESVSQMNVQFQMVAFNDVQTKSINLPIADSKKPLRIETTTFRDKLQPNSKEKWSVKVLGDDKEQINAEVLANMYDQSLDQFRANKYEWRKIYQQYFMASSYEMQNYLNQKNYSKDFKYLNGKSIKYPEFNWFNNRIYEIDEVVTVAYGQKNKNRVVGMVKKEAAMAVADAAMPSPETPKITKQLETTSGIANQEGQKENLQKIPVRQNLNETAFFYPNLMTDNDGNVNFEFTSPEALTQWKLMFLAHTKDARSAYLEKEVVTQKEFSVTPNYPRFLREGDELNLQSKLSNLTAQQLSGSATLQILDAFTNEDISGKFNLKNSTNSFELNANGNSVLNWKLKVPNGVSSIIIKVLAKAGNFTDGEQKAIPVLPNRMLVTDAQPIFVKEGQTKSFVLKNLAENTSTTATNVSNSLELTTNPIWEVMFALPSLKDDQNYSADVQFNKWFADVLASEIFKANPKMKAVFDEYQTKGLLNSNLEKNQELKQLLLEETPWVLDSKDETEQMRKLARIFDANTMRLSIKQDWSDLKKLQNPDGGFSWYAGYPSSYTTSLYILKNLGKLNEWLKGNVADYQSSEQKEMVSGLVKYLDNEISKYALTSLSKTNKENIWSNWVLDYLDSRHYWENQYPLKGSGLKLKEFVIQQAPKADIKDFTFFGLHRAALLFNEYKLTNLSKKLLTYLKDTSVQSETQGVYWKQNLNDWGWYSSKVVNHAGALEAFSKLSPADENFIEDMKIWLITQKEVSNWDTSRSTAEIIYTILNSGKSWTSSESDKTEITWGGKALVPQTQATGYIKQSVKSDKIDKNLATVTVKKATPGVVQGGVFWQYYEDLDKIKSSESYIFITKELYKKVKTVNGEELMKISENSPLKIGDKVTVRMILNTDRNMEYIHLKDMRAAGFEPVDVMSGYQWKNNLGYYQSTKDASTNFYIEYLPKGKYVFEYDYICNAAGAFSNGITTMQNYYAPQMNAYTKGSRVEINE